MNKAERQLLTECMSTEIRIKLNLDEFEKRFGFGNKFQEMVKTIATMQAGADEMQTNAKNAEIHVQALKARLEQERAKHARKLEEERLKEKTALKAEIEKLTESIEQFKLKQEELLKYMKH